MLIPTIYLLIIKLKLWKPYSKKDMPMGIIRGISFFLSSCFTKVVFTSENIEEEESDVFMYLENSLFSFD